METLLSSAVTTPVHPHGRGDNWGSARCSAMRVGSPPRAWGQWIGYRNEHSRLRFTPTGVGTIGGNGSGEAAISVHPHGRGDNQSSARVRSGTYGSPPRAWGQSDAPCPSYLHRRFTPTGVGTMRRCSVVSVVIAVHPHGRGDNDGTVVRYHRKRGSPPRAWGQCSTPRR